MAYQRVIKTDQLRMGWDIRYGVLILSFGFGSWVLCSESYSLTSSNTCRIHIRLFIAI